MTDKELLEKYGLDEQPIYRGQELQKALGKSTQMMQRMMREGVVKATKHGKFYEVTYEDLVEYLRSKENQEKPIRYLKPETQKELNEMCSQYGESPDEMVLNLIRIAKGIRPHMAENGNPFAVLNYIAENISMPRALVSMPMENGIETVVFSWPIEDEEIDGTD